MISAYSGTSVTASTICGAGATAGPSVRNSIDAAGGATPALDGVTAAGTTSVDGLITAAVGGTTGDTYDGTTSSAPRAATSAADATAASILRTPDHSWMDDKAQALAADSRILKLRAFVRTGIRTRYSLSFSAVNSGLSPAPVTSTPRTFTPSC